MQNVRYKALLTQEEKKKAFADFFAKDDAPIEQDKLDGLEAFLCSLNRAVILKGVCMYNSGKVLQMAFDAPVCTYTFAVRSETKTGYYTASFRPAKGSKAPEFAVSDLEVGCSCNWLNTGGGRICKHVVASMLYATMNARSEDSPGLRQIARFLFFAVSFVEPSWELMQKIKKCTRKEYEGAKAKLIKSLKGAMYFGNDIKGFLDKVEGAAKEEKLDECESSTIPVVAGLLRATLGGTYEGDYHNWTNGIFSEIESLKQDQTLSRYQTAENFKQKAAIMQGQLALMKAAVHPHLDTGPKLLMRHALKTWDEGITQRRKSAESMRTKGIVSKGLEASIKEEIALVVRLWKTYMYARNIMAEILKEANCCTPEKIVARLKE